jgi:hypothetical protein
MLIWENRRREEIGTEDWSRTIRERGEARAEQCLVGKDTVSSPTDPKVGSFFRHMVGSCLVAQHYFHVRVRWDCPSHGFVHVGLGFIAPTNTGAAEVPQIFMALPFFIPTLTIGLIQKKFKVMKKSNMYLNYIIIKIYNNYKFYFE